MDSQYSSLLSNAYMRLWSLQGFPWPTCELFVQEWTECLVADRTSFLGYRVRTKLSTWGDPGRIQAFNVLESLTPPGNYPAPMGEAVRKLKREQLGCVLEDSVNSLTLSESGSGESHLENSQGQALLSSSSWNSVTDIEAAERSNPLLDMDMTEDQSIISNSEEPPRVMEAADFRDMSLVESALPEVPEPYTGPNSSTLDLLIRANKSSKNAPVEHPKKEYFRCQHIRALKKSLRQLKEGKLPGASIHRMNRNRASQVHKWEEMKQFYRANQEELDKVSLTTAGPLTDGKSKREEIDVNAARSYKDAFVYDFFSTEAIRSYNRLFSDLVYDCSPAEICEKMKKTKCCREPHGERCREVWGLVCEYAKEGMWRELAARQL